MKIEIDKSDTINIWANKAELKNAYSNYDKFVMYNLMLDLLKIVDDMYKHIMSDEKEIEKEIGDE